MGATPVQCAHWMCQNTHQVYSVIVPILAEIQAEPRNRTPHLFPPKGGEGVWQCLGPLGLGRLLSSHMSAIGAQASCTWMTASGRSKASSFKSWLWMSTSGLGLLKVAADEDMQKSLVTEHLTKNKSLSHSLTPPALNVGCAQARREQVGHARAFNVLNQDLLEALSQHGPQVRVRRCHLGHDATPLFEAALPSSSDALLIFTHKHTNKQASKPETNYESQKRNSKAAQGPSLQALKPPHPEPNHRQVRAQEIAGHSFVSSPRLT